MDEQPNEPISDDVYKSVYKMVLSESHAEYDELCATWSALDTKAQGTVAISSAILAGLLVFLRFNYDRADPGFTMLLLVTVAIILIVTSLIWALLALIVREAACMDGAEPVLAAATNILSAEDDTGAKGKLRAFIEGYALRWQQINSDLHRDNERKSTRVFRAQQFIFSGVATSGFAILVSLIERIESSLKFVC